MDAGASITANVVPPSMLRARVSEAYASHSRDTLEEKWILENLPLVRHIVQKIAGKSGRHADLDDLISAGTVGLVKAAKSYDPSRDAEFRTYAYIRIRGAVIDELRSRSFAPANMHGQVRQIQDAFARLSGRLNRQPDDEELAAEVGLSLSQLYKTMEEARRQHFLSINGLAEDESPIGSLAPADRGPSPDAQAERLEMVERLTQAIAELSERDRTIILLYYERDLTMKEAAQVLGVTESRISQLHASALFKLSMKLKGPT